MDFFKCSLCTIAFDTGTHTPRMMPDCGHTFCQKCIQDRIHQGSVVCPEDDSVYQNHNNINGFPINTTLVQILRNTAPRKQQTTPTVQDYYPFKFNQSEKFQKQTSENNDQSDQQPDNDAKVKAFDYKNSSKQSITKSFETLPSWRNNEEDELKRLLTPSDFLKNLLGSLHEQTPDAQKKPELQQTNHNLQTQYSNQSTQQLPTQQLQLPTSQQKFTQPQVKKPELNHRDGIQQIIDKKENLYKEKITTKFEELVMMLQERLGQVMQEVHVIFEKISQGFIKAQIQNQANAKDLDIYLESILEKVQTEFQLQIELIIPRYCTIRNQLEASDYLMPHQRTPSFDQQYSQKSPAFAQQAKFLHSNNSSDEHSQYPPQSVRSLVNQDSAYPSQSFFKAQMKSEPDETVFHTFENVKTPFTQPTQYNEISLKPKTQQQNFSVPYDITNHRSPNYESNKPQPPQKKNVSPQKRIFDQVPSASPLVRAKQPLFSTPNKNPKSNQSITDGGFFQQIIDKLKKGVNVEQINLKDQNIGDFELQELAEQLKFTTSFVRTLTLSRNLITNDGLSILIQNIRKNKTIKSVNLKRNKLTDKCIDIIHQEYSKNKNNYLSQLFMKGNQIDSSQYLQEITEIQNFGIVIYM